MQTPDVNMHDDTDDRASDRNCTVDTCLASNEDEHGDSGTDEPIRWGGVDARRLENTRDAGPDVPSIVDRNAGVGEPDPCSCVSRLTGLLVPLYLACYATITQGGYSLNGTKVVLLWLRHGQDSKPLPPPKPGTPRPKRPVKRGWDSYRGLTHEYGWSYGTCNRLYESFIRAIQPCRRLDVVKALRLALCASLIRKPHHTSRRSRECDRLQAAANKMLRFWDYICKVAPRQRNGADPVRAIATTLMRQHTVLQARCGKDFRRPVHLKRPNLDTVFSALEAKIGAKTMDWIMSSVAAGLAATPLPQPKTVRQRRTNREAKSTKKEIRHA